MASNTFTISYPEKFIAEIAQVPQVIHNRVSQRLYANSPDLNTTFQYEKIEEGCYLFVVDMHAVKDTVINILGDRTTEYYCLSYQLIRGQVAKVPQNHTDKWQAETLSLPRICSFYNNEFDYETSFDEQSGVRAFIFCFTKKWLQNVMPLNEMDAGLAMMQVINKQVNGIAYFNDNFYKQTYDELDRLLQSEERTPVYKLVVKKLSLTLISDFFSIVADPNSILNLPEQPHEFNGVEAVKDYLDQYFHKGFPGLAFLAELANMTVPTLRRQFGRQMGHSAFDYFRTIQMRYAFEQLQKGKQVKQVAAALGYNSPSNFSRVFKAVYQVSPLQVIGL